MDKHYTVKVNNQEDFNINPSEINQLDMVKNSEGHYHVLQQNKSFKIEVLAGDLNSKCYQINVNGTNYDIQISNDLDRLIETMGLSNHVSQQVNTVIAPMPGLILDVQVKVGQEVQENTPLLILEAMKMENSIVSPRTGVIKSISVKKGEAVEKGHLIIEFE
ncbi:acetyl-CoA carboxylase biotin carboxyl carrier protein subunit [Tamlana agarivorans]|uniref:Acetyl-CoA carboxylase biotin carboxyl carrier protein subunit n=1 Tax=Pseudotamlana agarivorans TaxID=481183 RepID=A0ACC5UBU0_9FLAO|nr:acetyl-CoA carboxylase biotin carboxyl carrier protein subunit [Tamlana agarivorans]MBU2951787.1 acetyl-CoA carboxylase biotin carboxyl carrier protein subunit [Tamlana agarivorans]